MGGIASGLWIGTNIVKTYDCRTSEEKIRSDYIHVFPELWQRYERRCYKQYLDEADDTSHDKEHVYHSLKYVVGKCRYTVKQDSTVQTVGDCHYRIRDLADVCLFHDVAEPLERDDRISHEVIGEMLKSGGYMDSRRHWGART